MLKLPCDILFLPTSVSLVLINPEVFFIIYAIVNKYYV